MNALPFLLGLFLWCFSIHTSNAATTLNLIYNESIISTDFDGTVTETNTNTNNNNNNTGDITGIRNGYPSEALEYYGVFQEHASICGASLISEGVAITAAHCVFSKGFPGAIRFHSTERLSGGTRVSVIGGTVHPNWNGKDPTNGDLALLYLSTPITNLQPATIVKDSNLPNRNGAPLHVAGFGLTGEKGNGGASPVLMATSLPTILNCQSLFGRYDPLKHVCAESSNTATCAGDSGSPVILDGTNIQIGVNSFSNGDCMTQTLDVYTRLSYYYDWIRQQICENSISSSDRQAACGTDIPTATFTAAPDSSSGGGGSSSSSSSSSSSGGSGTDNNDDDNNDDDGFFANFLETIQSLFSFLFGWWNVAFEEVGEENLRH